MSARSHAAQVRRRRLPEEAEQEILAAAQAALTEGPFRDLSVEDLMRRTGMTRSSFYHYFSSLDAVVNALLRRVQAEMISAALPWLEVGRDEDPVNSVRRAIRDVAAVYARHGRVLAAIHEASFHHEAVHEAWREGVLEEWIRAVADQLRRQHDRGVTPVEDADEVARALLLMNTAVFAERLGIQQVASPDAVAQTLSRIWIGAIYPEAVRVTAQAGRRRD